MWTVSNRRDHPIAFYDAVGNGHRLLPGESVAADLDQAQVASYRGLWGDEAVESADDTVESTEDAGASIELEAIGGLGPAWADRLRGWGFADVRALAAMTDEEAGRRVATSSLTRSVYKWRDSAREMSIAAPDRRRA